MADFTERVLEPANLLVVNNLQTLVIRQLERDMALAQVWAGACVLAVCVSTCDDCDPAAGARHDANK